MLVLSVQPWNSKGLNWRGGQGGKSPFSLLSESISPSSLLFWANFSLLPKRLRFFFSLLPTFSPCFSLPTFFGPFLPPPYSVPPPSKLALFPFFWGPSLIAMRDSRNGVVWQKHCVIETGIKCLFSDRVFIFSFINKWWSIILDDQQLHVFLIYSLFN